MSRYFRITFAVLCLVTTGFLWLPVVSSALAIKSFDSYSVRGLVLLVAISYVLGWGGYFSLSRNPIPIKIANCALTTATFLLLSVLIELPALLGLIDYRLVIAPSTSVLFTRFKPWQNPMYKLDRELGWLRRPDYRIRGEYAGDLVHWLGIHTNQRYQVDVQYDSRGFRNAHEIEQAPVVVIGDSFLEWPLVPEAALLSTRLSQLLHVEVANLSQSAYGPQQELVVLRRYGLKLNPKIAIWFFFEGNDLLDVQRYKRLIQDWTIEELHSFKERSFSKNALLALAGLIAPTSHKDVDEARRRSCRFLRTQNKERNTLYFAYAGSPLSREELASLAIAQGSILDAQQLSTNNGAKLLVVYIPTKFRVYRDFCAFPDDGYGKDWQVNDLPSRFENWATAQGVPYIDLTAALKAAAASGELVYFPDDGHWNTKGHEIAAQSIYNFLKKDSWL